MENYSIHDIIGLIGVVIILVTYYLLQSSRIKSISFTYSITNLIGAGLILYSLFFKWNLSAVIVEIAWMLISIYGIYKAVHTHRSLSTIEKKMDDHASK